MSAREWTASASIEEELVNTKPMNLAMAIPRFAKKAARIAFLPPVGPDISRRAPPSPG